MPALARCTRRAQETDRWSRSERLGSLRHGKRLGILGAQAKHEPEPVQQQARASDAAELGKQRVGTLEGALRFGADAEHVEGRHAAKRRERDLQRVALRARGAWSSEAQRHAR